MHLSILLCFQLPIIRNMEEGNFDINKNYLNIPEPKEGEKVGKYIKLSVLNFLYT